MYRVYLAYWMPMGEAIQRYQNDISKMGYMIDNYVGIRSNSVGCYIEVIKK